MNIFEKEFKIIEDSTKKINENIEQTNEREIYLKNLMDKVIDKLGNFEQGKGFKSTYLEALTRIIESYSKLPIERAKLYKLLIDVETKKIDILSKQEQIDIEKENSNVSINDLYSMMKNMNINPNFNDNEEESVKVINS